MKKRKIKKREKGSVGTEATLTIIGFLFILNLSFLLISLSFSHFWVQQSLYEGLICLGKHLSSVQFCEKEVKEKITLFLPLKSLNHLSLKKAPTTLEANIKFSMMSVSFRKTLILEKKHLKPSLEIKKVLF